MESKSASVAKREVSWSQKLTDFSIILEEGKKIRVHKHVLAENSEAFEAMLTQQFEETQSNEMILEHFDQDTVLSFIEYLYAGSINHPDTIEQIRAALGPDEYIYKRGFNKEKFTIDLLGMADMYQVEDLKADCTEYLKRNITDQNVIGVWLGAETLGNESLSSIAIEHLLERPRGKPFKELPGFSDAFPSSNKPLKKLVDILSEKNHHLKEEISNLKGEVLEGQRCQRRLKEKLTRLQSGTIKIDVISAHWSEAINIQNTKKISTLLHEINNRKHGIFSLLSKNPRHPFHNLDLNSTFLKEGIFFDTTLYAWKD